MKKLISFLIIASLFISCKDKSDAEDAGKRAPSFDEVVITDITTKSATFSCQLLSSGDYEIMEKGFAFGFESNPIKTGYTVKAESDYSNNFSTTVTGLDANTKYYVSPYVKVGDDKYIEGKTQEVSFTTKVQGDYSTAIVQSDNYNLDISLVGCIRSGSRVTIEATILNKGINPCDSYYMYSIGNGYSSGSITYHTYIEDDLYTDYNYNQLGFYLNNRSNTGGTMSTQLPVGSTKILKITIDGVPVLAKQISVYIATQFMGTSPTEYAFLTFKNVPIY